MTRANVAMSNVVGGELSPLMYGRTDLPIAKKGVAWAQNFYALPQGAAQYRPGFKRVRHTRQNKVARFIPFQYNDEQSYLIEVTDQYFRFYKDNSIILEDPQNITGITQATEPVITIAGHGYSDGDELDLYDIEGMTELNGMAVIVDTATTNTFKIKDIWGNYIDTTGFTAYSSGGTASRVYEIRTPYLESDMDLIQYTQNTDTMYLNHLYYASRKLTRTGHTNWNIGRYTRTADPFTQPKAITNITQANPGVVTVTGHGRAVGDEIFIDSVVGMTELNQNHYLINTVVDANNVTLKTMDGTPLDTTAFTAYTSGGNFEHVGNTGYPRAVTFTSDGRVLHAGTAAKPETVWGSRSPTSGSTNYDDFTTGTAATDAVVFTLAPVHGQTNAIQWLSNTDKFIVAGTFGTIRRIYGSTEQASITPNDINAKSVNNYGAAAMAPITFGTNIFYIQRGRQIVRSFEYDYVQDGYLTTDRNLVADHLPYPGLKEIVNQQGKVEVIWGVRDDGGLLGLTFKDKENISGWHKHFMGGSHSDENSKTRRFGKTLSVSAMPRPNSQEQIWAIAERQINNRVSRSVEYMTDLPVYPDEREFYTGQGNRDSDLEKYENRKYEIQKQAIHLDMCATYDGSVYGTDASAGVTPGATSGESVTFTADANVFTSDMVGREIWKAFDINGDGGGRAEITAYVSATEVTCDILDGADFDNTNKMAAGEWYLTADNLSGLDHLEGETVGIIADGGPDNDGTVTNGELTLERQASVVHVGLKYTGILETLNIDAGGVTGSAQAKKRNVQETVFRFLNTSGAQFGTDLYNLKQIEFRRGDDPASRPIPLMSGNMEQSYSDEWEREKHLYVVQEQPLPCTVTVMDVFMETTDE